MIAATLMWAMSHKSGRCQLCPFAGGRVMQYVLVAISLRAVATVVQNRAVWLA